MRLRCLLTFVTTVMAEQTSSERTPASGSYLKAKACVEKATRNFAEVETIGAKEVLQLQADGKKVVLVDVRTEEEMEVSMIRGGITRESFESSRLGAIAKCGEKPPDFSRGVGDDGIVVVPYCTVGYRSGQYAKKLMGLGYPAVRNSEGVVLWTHDVGSGLVTTDTAQVSRDGQQGSSENGQQNAPEIDAGAGTSAGNGEVEVKRVHVYGSSWDHAREDFETVKFTPTGWLGSGIKATFSKIFGGKK